MQENANLNAGKYKWSLAATDGLILSAVTVVTSSITQLLTTNLEKVPGFVSFVIWLLQIGGSLYVLYNCMKKYGNETHARSTFGFGFITSLFSSLICSVFAIAAYLWIFPGMQDEITKSFDMILPLMKSDEQRDMLFKIEDNFAQWLFISNMIKDTLIGLIAAAIMAGPTSRKKDIFTADAE